MVSPPKDGLFPFQMAENFMFFCSMGVILTTYVRPGMILQVGDSGG